MRGYETKVEQLGDVRYAASLAKHDVAGLDIAVRKACAMRFLQRARNLPKHVEGMEFELSAGGMVKDKNNIAGEVIAPAGMGSFPFTMKRVP